MEIYEKTHSYNNGLQFLKYRVEQLITSQSKVSFAITFGYSYFVLLFALTLCYSK